MMKSAMLPIMAEGLSHLKRTWFRRKPLEDFTRYDMGKPRCMGLSSTALDSAWPQSRRHRGAVITIAAIAADPFAQQVVRFYSCGVTAPSLRAPIPRTNQYLEAGVHLGTVETTCPSGLQQAINGGVSNLATITTPFECTTGQLYDL